MEELHGAFSLFLTFKSDRRKKLFTPVIRVPTPLLKEIKNHPGNLVYLPNLVIHKNGLLGFSRLNLQRRQRHPTPVLLPGKSHGRRSLVGCSSWVIKSRTRLSDFIFTFYFHALEKEMETHSSALAWRIPGMGEPGGLLSMGSHRSDTTEVT